jgi:hypothetical protein
MAKFTFETYTYQVWFEADSLEQAEALLEQVEESEIEITDLPAFLSKDKGYAFEATTVSKESI